MNNIYDARQHLKYVFIISAILIAIASLVTSNSLIEKLADEEREKVKIWAGAAQALIKSDDPEIIKLSLNILESNTTIPALLCDENNQIVYQKNMTLPEKNSESFLSNKIEELTKKNKSISIELEDGTNQYIYYDDSIFLKHLIIFPYIQLSVVFVFILIAFFALDSTKKAEQNKVWVGLSKETAHQLGTPISSLIAWVEYLRLKNNIDEHLLSEMAKDVKRLEIIAERFSKIGSNPEPLPVCINDSIRLAIEYVGARISPKVKISIELPDEPVFVQINDSLFAWVIENLVKNAVDAMEGQGQLNIKLGLTRKNACIDVSDTGKGLSKSKFKTIFSPGYTTKARGWGLGLSLVKRIIESYHGGKIFVKCSEIGRGTTFRIELRKSRK
ncbi:MAG: HAMP domain-containing histidine kinase [Dysgonamonadaceae bacterium]|nr:HAMP domain-containing histidine kinase [Dysgonamonadaceae bacterium]